MDKTPFAGLTRLDPGEPLSTDGSSFTGINPTIIDRLLNIGARLHRHDAHPAIIAPSEPPVVEQGATGGFIPAGVTAVVTYTLIDSQGGETLPAPSIGFTTPDGVVAPEDTPEYTVESVAGDMLSGTYYYGLTLTDGSGGETTIGPVITVDIPAGSGSNQVRFVGLSDIVAGYPGAQGWRLYKGSQYNRMHFLASGNAALDEVLDDGNLCADCATTPPDDNTTAATNSIDITIPAHPINEATPVVAYRIYVGVGGDLSSPALLGQFAIAELGIVRNVLDLQMEPGAPPDYPTAIGGATKIDPNTDILDFHWKPPVETHAELPEGARGDVRMTLENGRMWVVLASEAFGPDQWTQIGTTTGGGGGHEIWDEGLLVGPQGILDFVGEGVTVTEDAGIGKLVVTIPGGGGGSATYPGGTFASATVDEVIPDNNTYLESVVLPVADAAIIGTDTDYPKLFLWIQHAYISDLVIELVAPDGTMVQVLPGDTGEANLGTGVGTVQRAYFHPYALLPYTALPADAVGEWMPSGDWTPLIGKNVTGDWRVRVRDLYAGGAGLLKGWGLVFTAGATEQPQTVPLLTTQAVEWREGTHVGPVRARLFQREVGDHYVNEPFPAAGWPAPTYYVDEANMGTLAVGGGVLTPTDLTDKKFVYGSQYIAPVDVWWMDDFHMTMRFNILTLATFGSISFGIKDSAGNKIGCRLRDDLSWLIVFEEYDGVDAEPDGVAAPALAVGVGYLTMERVGENFHFGLWTADPALAASAPLYTFQYSPSPANVEKWQRGLSNKFRPYFGLRPDAVDAVTYFGAGSRIDYGHRLRTGINKAEIWAWTKDKDNTDLKRARRLAGSGFDDLYPVFQFGVPAWHSAVTASTAQMIRDGRYVKLSGLLTLGLATDLTVSPPRGIPRRMWPQDEQYVFVPYTSPDATKAGETWRISVTGVITRFGASATNNKRVSLAGIQWLAKDSHK